MTSAVRGTFTGVQVSLHWHPGDDQPKVSPENGRPAPEGISHGRSETLNGGWRYIKDLSVTNPPIFPRTKFRPLLESRRKKPRLRQRVRRTHEIVLPGIVARAQPVDETLRPV
jgi:hypothetical protein